MLPAPTIVMPEPVRTASRPVSSTSAAMPVSGGPAGSSTRTLRPTVTHQRRYSVRRAQVPAPAAAGAASAGGAAGAAGAGDAAGAARPGVPLMPRCRWCRRPRRVPGGELGEHVLQHPSPVQAGRVLQEQRGRRGHRQLRRGERDVEPDADHDRVAVRLGEDPGDLPVPHEHVVRPLQPGGDARPGAQRGRDRDPGEQRQPGAGRRRHGHRAEQHRAGQRGPRRARPRPPDARPRPAVCVSATRTSPSAAPARASCSRSALVEPVSAVTRISRHRPPGQTRLALRAAVSSGGRGGAPAGGAASLEAMTSHDPGHPGTPTAPPTPPGPLPPPKSSVTGKAGVRSVVQRDLTHAEREAVAEATQATRGAGPGGPGDLGGRATGRPRRSEAAQAARGKQAGAASLQRPPTHSSPHPHQPHG